MNTVPIPSNRQPEQIVQIPLDMLHSFSDHPFQVRDDAFMQELVNSLKAKGVLVPGIVRPRQQGGYQIISGHRRRLACELSSLSTMPVIVRDIDNDEATVIMVDSNLQREHLLPSERAWAYRMKLEALNHQGHKSERIPLGKLSVDVLAEENSGQKGFSKNQIYRYIRLPELVPFLLDMVDAQRIAFTSAVELSYLSRIQQAQLLDMIAKYDATPSLSQAQQLKRLHKKNHLTTYDLKPTEKITGWAIPFSFILHEIGEAIDKNIGFVFVHGLLHAGFVKL